MVKPRFSILCVLVLLLSAGSLFAEGQVFWQQGGVSVRDSTVGRVCGIVSDDSGGAIAVWTDNRRLPIYDAIFLQRIDSSGSRLWLDSGIAACQPLERADWLVAAADGAGGVAMFWLRGNIRLCAQRLGGNGTRPWGDTSMVVFETTGVELEFKDQGMCSDGRGGCVALWTMSYAHGGDSIVLRAQYMDSLGRRVWGTQGRRIARDLATYGSIGVVDLGSDGFVFTWIRDDGEICAKRLDASGNEVWTASVCSGVPVYGWPSLVRTGGGVFVCWTDMRNGDWDVYAQKLNAAGNPLWAQNGVPVCRAAGQQGGWVDFLGDMVHVTGLPDGGALVAFYDRSRGATSISCQRLSASGDMMWDSSGVEAGRIMDKDTLFTGTMFGLVPDMTGGAMVTWPKYCPGDSVQIWAQHLDAAGSARWDAGVRISEYAGYGFPAFFSITDDKNGAIGCWGFHSSIFAQRYGDGPTSLAEPHANQASAARLTCPNPLRTGATISLPQCGEQGVTLDLFDACGRKVADLHPGANDVRALAPGVYFIREGLGTRGEGLGKTRKIVLTD